MSSALATRCTTCGTVFRVVPDQLRVSEGWVRCGRCAEVFNAAECLVDAETGAPRAAPEGLLHPEGGAPPVAATPSAPPSPAAEEAETADFEVDIAFDTLAPGPAEEDRIGSKRAVDTDDGPPFDAPAADPAEGSARAAGAPAPVDSEMRADRSDQPSFLRRAERAQRWRRPGVRAALAVLLVLGVLGLAGQATYLFRDLVAARYGAARPALEAACSLLGCTIDAPHLIDSLMVESSGLARVERSDVYRLSVALHNRAPIEAALPALDLSLTDSQGKLLARRVLRPAELGASASSLGAGRDLSLQATLRAATDAVAGYTVEIFYP